MKKSQLVAFTLLLGVSASLTGWAAEADKTVSCTCPCHFEQPDVTGKASDKPHDADDDNMNMLNNAEPKASQAQSEFLREQIYSW